MRSGLTALRAAGAATVLVLAPAATAAYAHDSVKATVVPSTAVRGGEVEVLVAGCKGTTGAAKSEAFVADAELADAELSGRDGPGKRLFGDTTVKSSVNPGTYDINVDCDGHDHPGSGKVKVVAHKPTQQPTKQPKQPKQQTAQPTQQPPTPVAPVRAGGGGTAQLAAGDQDPAAEAGPGTPHTVIGLVLAGVAAVAVAFRSSRRRRTDAD